MLDDVETYINERPDSALVVLRALDSTAVRSRALRARAALLHSIALDKNYIDLQTDSILAPAVIWYSRHGSPDEKLKVRYYLGRLQYNAGNYQEAIVTYTEALELTKKARDLKYLGFVNQAIADTYCISNIEQEAIPYLLVAKDCFGRSENEELALSTEYKLATVYATEEMLPQADSLFRDLSNKDLPGWLRMRVLSDQALFLVAHLNDAEGAILVFEQAMEEFGTLLSLNHWAAFAYALSTVGQEQKSNALFEQIKESFKADPLLSYWEARTAEQKRDYKNAYLGLSQSLSYQDSLVRERLKQSAIVSQKEYYHTRNQMIETSLEARRLRVWLIASFFFIISMGMLFYLFLRMRDYRIQALNYTRLMETLDREMNEMRENHEQLFQAYMFIFGQLSEEYERTKETGRLDGVSFRRLKRVIANIKGEGKGTFEEIINHQLNNLMTDFRSDFGSILKEDDIILVSYLFSGFGTDTASTLLGISPEAFYMRKSRIKKVLKQSNDEIAKRYLPYFEKRR